MSDPHEIDSHLDHKFEWTTEEWTKYCTDAASKFGYAVDISGVGLAVEPDPWKRESELGFASQVAAFRRLDTELPKGHGFRSETRNRPVLRAKHLHLTYPLSIEELAHPAVLAEVCGAVTAAMTENRERSMTLFELWLQGEVSLKCAGDIGTLVRAIKPENIDHEEWEVEDETKGWEARVSWKNFGKFSSLIKLWCSIDNKPLVAIEKQEQSEFGACPSVSAGIDDYWPSREAVADDLFSQEPAPPYNEDGVEKESYSWDQESYSWGSASEGASDPWVWKDTSAEPCSSPGAILWTLPAAGEKHDVSTSEHTRV